MCVCVYRVCVCVPACMRVCVCMNMHYESIAFRKEVPELLKVFLPGEKDTDRKRNHKQKRHGTEEVKLNCMVLYSSFTALSTCVELYNC